MKLPEITSPEPTEPHAFKSDLIRICANTQALTMALVWSKKMPNMWVKLTER